MKKIIHFFRYIKLLKANKEALGNSRVNNNPNPLGIQYDWIYRLYTVLNLPFDDNENIDKYGYYYIDNMVQTHIREINNYLFDLGILEYVDLDTDEIIQLDDNNIRIVLKFKFLNIKKMIRRFVFALPFIIILGLIIIFIFL